MSDFSKAAYSIDLWPEGFMPGHGAQAPEQDTDDHRGNVDRLTNVSKPALYVYPAQNPTKNPAPAMIVCPGGGYSILAWNLEGTEIAEFIAQNGMTAIILKYRCPNNREGAFQDAQRAIRLARLNADKWGIDPAKIGIMGFSAGGHLTVRATCKYDEQSYNPIDEADSRSPKPDFAVPVYPAYLNKDEQVAPELLPLVNLPPILAIHNADDPTFVKGTRIFVNALAEGGFDFCFRHYQDGGHGYGLRSAKSVKDWGRAMILWFKEKRIL